MFSKIEKAWTNNAYTLLSNLAEDYTENLLQKNVTIEDAMAIANESSIATYMRAGAFIALVILLLRRNYQGKIITESNYNYFLNNSNLSMSDYIRDLNSWTNSSLSNLKEIYLRMLVHIYKEEKQSGHTFKLVIEE